MSAEQDTAAMTPDDLPEIATGLAQIKAWYEQAASKPSVVLVGHMGSGKSTLGRKLAEALELPFFDADEAIERAAGKPISDIFADHGEAEFRAGEERVIARLLREQGPMVLATGGGAFISERTRAEISAKGVSIWLKVPLDILIERTARRTHRPLLANKDPRQVFTQLFELRDPLYAQANIISEFGQTKTACKTEFEAETQSYLAQMITELAAYLVCTAGVQSQAQGKDQAS